MSAFIFILMQMKNHFIKTILDPVFVFYSLALFV